MAATVEDPPVLDLEHVVGEDDRVSLRYVRAGAPAPDNMIEILSGLDEGERIAAYPALATGRARGRAAQ